MSFVLHCPHCGPREVYEFRYGGQIVSPPVVRNLPGVQHERWYHRHGCKQWLAAERNVTTNEVLSVRSLEGEAG
jgi:sarcosine oxidase subunit delta